MKYGLKKQLKMSAAGFAMLAGAAVPMSALAAEVTLKSTDGTINLTGEFVDYKDDSYIIRTTLGDLRIAGNRVFCEGAACPTFNDTSSDVTLVGSETIGLGMMPLLMTGFASSMDAEADVTNPSASSALATLVSDGGFGDEIGSYLVSSADDAAAFEALLDGSASIGMSSRRITRDEARALRADGAGSMVSPEQERIIAVDSMVVATHASNGVDALTIDQLRGIFSGQITNWNQLGGHDGRINVVARNDDSASYDYFMSYLFGDEVPNFRPQAISSDDQVVSNVLYTDKHAIGYLGYAFQRGAKPITLINECGIATTPDAFAAKTEEYELNRRMYLYSRADATDSKAQQFLDFAVSPEADGVIAKSGFIDLGIVRRAQDTNAGRGAQLAAEAAQYDSGFEGDVVKEMLAKMENYDRLSTTLRFRTGSSKIDERGQLDIERLVNFLDRAPDGTQVSLVGFTDDVGAFEGNRDLSVGRAQSVLDTVRDVAGDRLDHIQFATAGFGEVAPSACNVTDRGRSINRRVEVWISKSTAG